MAENLSIKKSPVDSVIECPLCLHQLTLPQTLQQCLHSYCKSCLDKVPQKTQDGRQGWLCPVCENFTKCDQIQQNTFIEELQKIQADQDVCEKIKCEQCSDDCSPAKWKCTDCKIGLCESAKITHLKIPMLKGHKIVPMDSFGEKLIDNIIFCNIHADIPVQQNCHDCDQLICYNCNTTDHKGHIAETVEEALERILPETESNTRQVDENIGIIQVQIEGINKMIEQTRESYASYRMQMDEHLEKVICQMRAMKAQMEEDVNEQESICFDTLTELKQQLEKQLNQARIISHLTDVVTTKTRHTSQLQQLQTGLFEKVKGIGRSKNADLDFQMPDTKFIEGHNIKEELENVFGGLRFDLKSNHISTSGEVWVEKENFMIHDFEDIVDCSFTQSLEIDTESKYCNRLSLIDNQLWLPIADDSLIKIYNQDGKLENTIDTGENTINVVRETYNVDLICGGDNGLYKTNKDFTEWTMLAEGMFSDVLVHQRSFFALEYVSGYVHQYIFTADGQWQRSHKHKLVADEEIDFNLNCNSTLSCSGNHFWITSDQNSTIYQLSNVGKYLQMWEKESIDPSFCEVDHNGNVLWADYNVGHFYLLDTKQKDEITIKKIWQSLTVDGVRDAVFDRNNDLWTLSGNSNQKLKKLTQNKIN